MVVLAEDGLDCWVAVEAVDVAGDEGAELVGERVDGLEKHISLLSVVSVPCLVLFSLPSPHITRTHL